MKISLEWLKSLVPLPESADALAEALTSGGTEVTGIARRGELPDHVVVAQILSSEQHPNADRLSVCKVDVGSGTPRQIVCGAKNYKVGDKVPLALPGAVLGPDFKIKSGKLRGVASEGMMCSAKELGLAEDAEGLLILSPDAPVGKPLKDLFAADVVLELEVTPNRPDMLSYRGVAREVAALTQVEPAMVALPEAPVEDAGELVLLEDGGCPFYSARIVRGVKIGPSPQWMADRLSAAGVRPINNVVDATNYVMLETGQPLHAFDLAKLNGGIVVRAAREGEKLKALDGSCLELRSRDIVIADRDKPVALAGVMGGEETGVTTDTADILLESAWFEPARVRRTSRELGLQTDSSYRFERRVDPQGVLSASARAVELILQIAGGVADSAVRVAGSLPEDGNVVVKMDGERCRALLGFAIEDGEIAAILGRLGLVSVGDSRWRIPSFRPDLTREIDLVEEVIRMAGIERVPSTLRGVPAAATKGDLRHDRSEILRERLRAQGFSEARTSHFVSPEALRRAGVDGGTAVAIRNPLGADQALLRPSLLAGLLGALAHNLRHGASSVRLFELGRVFGCAAPEEQTALGIITTGAAASGSWQAGAREADFYDIKGVLRPVLGDIDFRSCGDCGICLCIQGSGVSGTVRRLPNDLAEAHEAKVPVYYAEVLVDGWLESAGAVSKVKDLPKFPGTARDLTVILPSSTSYAQLEKALGSARAPHLREILLKGVFTDPSGKTLDPSQRALTVSLTFRDDARTLTSLEVDRAMETLRDHAKAELGAVFRG